MTGMPESAAPKLGKVDSLVSMEVDVPENANGVLYALAGFSGGVTCYVNDGFLSYEFNLFEVQRTKIAAGKKLPTGKSTLEVESKLVDRIGGPMDVTLRINGEDVGKAGCRRQCRCTSPRMRPSTSAATSIHRCRSTTSTRRRSPSTGRLERPKSPISKQIPEAWAF